MNEEISDLFGDDPLALFHTWLEEAKESEPNDPEAACLATADAKGHPSARMMLIKEMNEKGFKFHTNAESRKGEELAANPQAELCFYWKTLHRQVRVRGVIQPIQERETEEYFASRPLRSRIGAWASQQSRPYQRRAEMEGVIAANEDKYKDADIVPKPPYWKGYRLVPSSIEFWIAETNRLHMRFVYSRQPNGNWDSTWLHP